MRPVDSLARVKSFLQSHHYKECRHSAVQLYRDYFFVQREPQGPLDQIEY